MISLNFIHKVCIYLITFTLIVLIVVFFFNYRQQARLNRYLNLIIFISSKE